MISKLILHIHTCNLNHTLLHYLIQYTILHNILCYKIVETIKPDAGKGSIVNIHFKDLYGETLFDLSTMEAVLAAFQVSVNSHYTLFLTSITTLYLSYCMCIVCVRCPYYPCPHIRKVPSGLVPPLPTLPHLRHCCHQQ